MESCHVVRTHQWWHGAVLVTVSRATYGARVGVVATLGFHLRMFRCTLCIFLKTNDK